MAVSNVRNTLYLVGTTIPRLFYFDASRFPCRFAVSSFSRKTGEKRQPKEKRAVSGSGSLSLALSPLFLICLVALAGHVLGSLRHTCARSGKRSTCIAPHSYSPVSKENRDHLTWRQAIRGGGGFSQNEKLNTPRSGSTEIARGIKQSNGEATARSGDSPGDPPVT